jgi:hypothetical protein
VSGQPLLPERAPAAALLRPRGPMSATMPRSKRIAKPHLQRSILPQYASCYFL